MVRCALSRCCGMNLHTATRVAMIYTMIASLIMTALTIVDLADILLPNFEMQGTFNASWRLHINDVMTALDSLMIVAHLFIFFISMLTFAVSGSEDTKLNVCMLLFFSVAMSLYILLEFATSMYFFTWMNHNIFELGYLGFLWGFWIARTVTNIAVVFCTHSRIIDLKFQKKYDLLNMPGVNHSLGTASMLSGSMRSVAGQQMLKAMSSQRLAASRQSLAQSQRSINQSQQSLNRAANF